MASTAERLASQVAVILFESGIVGNNVFRDRQDAFALQEGSAIVVEITEDAATQYGGSQQFGSFGSSDVGEVAIAIHYCTRNAAWQTVLDDLREQAHASLCASELISETVAGFRRTTATWDAASTDTPFGTITQRYVGKYHAQSNTL